MIVFSPAKKPFSFGHPNVQSVLNCFLSRNSNCLNPSSNHLVVESRRNANAHELNVELSQLMNQLESESKRGDALEKMRKVGRKQCWWENPIEELGLQEMEQLKASMEELKKNVTRQAYQLMNEINSVTNTDCSEYFVMNNGVRQSVDIFERKSTVIISSSSTNIPNVFSFK
ncbi:agamous-like MADS-box protein AGL62 [Ziziphus jujuba]|uniref:Agamous-like MADS-box protein AGL62 n=1 Tax=Ziziphus jujuba TaxID=326968 RepID=A0ABM3ZRS9_ZIZJJ|nr:agamous-like MADS-box protein AGL62 [Ziziphus jujuba]